MLDWYQFCIFEKEEKVLWFQIFNVGSSLPRRSAEGIGGPIPIEVDGQKVSPLKIMKVHGFPYIL